MCYGTALLFDTRVCVKIWSQCEGQSCVCSNHLVCRGLIDLPFLHSSRRCICQTARCTTPPVPVLGWMSRSCHSYCLSTDNNFTCTYKTHLPAILNIPFCLIFACCRHPRHEGYNRVLVPIHAHSTSCENKSASRINGANLSASREKIHPVCVCLAFL